MKKDVLSGNFYRRPTVTVASELLGKHLVRRTRDGELAFPITEVEAYDGFRDKASHAHRGRTPRNAVMFGPPGVWYVYLCYGVHWLLNIVTGPEDFPAAVLIRGAGEVRGPGRLTRRLEVTGGRNLAPATPESGLWIEDRGVRPRRGEIARTPRIGIGYAGTVWGAKPYRFVWDSPRSSS